MKRTIVINLSGFAYTIEEDAHDRLKGYLDKVRIYLGGGEDAEETMTDLDARLAELFTPVTMNQRSITIADVEEVIRIIGDPEVFASDTVTEDGSRKDTKGGDDGSAKEVPFVPVRRRLYRDPYSRVLGGVCSGLGAYFRMDPFVFRILFVIGFFFGISIIPYIFLWIAMPKAITIEQRSQMYGGEPFANYNPAAKKSARNNTGINRVFIVLRVILGIILTLVSFITLTGLVFSLVFMGKATSLAPEMVPAIEMARLFAGNLNGTLFVVGLWLTIGIPVLMILYLGLHLIFNFRSGGKLIGALALLLWLGGIGSLAYGSIATMMEFRERASVELPVIPGSFTGDTLYIRASDLNYSGDDMNITFKNILLRYDKEKDLFYDEPEIRIVEGADNLAFVVQKKSYGPTEQKARDYADKIDYYIEFNGSELVIDRAFRIPGDSGIRKQKVIVRVMVPEGVHVEVDSSLKRLTRWSIN